MNSNLITKGVRYALMAGAASALAAPSAFAVVADQNSNANTNTTNTTQLGKIEVTGTRIKRTDVETAQPVTIISAQQLKATGLNSIGDILQTVTQSGAALNTTFNNGGNGRTNIDLRFLGANRVLVLVNGRRWIPGLGGPGNQGVDLNEIPVSIIDHIEILQDGAAAIYGSDAIAGVVNLITIKNFNGGEANAYTSFYHEDKYGFKHNDGKVQEYDFTIGSSGDKSAVLLNATYVNQHEVWAGARSISKEPIWTAGAPSGSSAAANGRFRFAGKPFAGKTVGTGACAPFNPASRSYGTCDLTLQAPQAAGAAPSLTAFKNFGNADRFNFAPLNYFVTPNERTSLYAQGHYDLADNLSFSTEAVFNKRQSQQALAPSPIFLGNGFSLENGKFIGIGKVNPFNPFGVDLVGNVSQYCTSGVNARCPNGNNELLALLGRRPVEGGLRQFNENVETFQINSGFKGYFNLFGNEWDWDVGYGYADDLSSNITTGLFNTERLAQALDSPGVNAAPCAATAGCVPFNIFGGAGTITPAMLNFVQFEEHDVVDVQMRDYTANINGSLADLPAGPLGFAAGYEYLEFNGFFHPDATVSGGNTTGSVAQPTDGREKTNAEYFELDIPLVADAPFAKILDLDLAERWSQFKWFGGNPGQPASAIVHDDHTSTGRAALKWQPTDSLLIRGSWSQGFRLPSVSELFLGNSDSFPLVADPCAPGPTGGWDGVPADLPAGCGGRVHTQPNAQIRSTIGGNPRLHPETSKSKTAGFVYNPDWIPGFDVSLDLYNIDIEQLVTRIAAQQILNDCYISQVASACNNITLNGNIVNDIFDANTNIGGEHTRGIDLASHYKLPSTSVGDFKLGLDWTFLQSFVLVQPFNCTNLEAHAPGSPFGCTPATVGAAKFRSTEFAGSTTSFGGYAKQKANASLMWNYGNFNVAWNVQYIASMFEPCTGGGRTAHECTDPNRYPAGQQVFSAIGHGSFGRLNAPLGSNHIGATVYHDVQGTYHMDSWNTDFTFGVRNLFDKQPPAALTAFANTFLPSFYRVPGIEFWGRVSVKF